MRGSTSISNSTGRSQIAFALALLAFAGRPSFAAEPSPNAKSDRTVQPEEEDFQGTPYTQYGEFNDDQEEEDETKFLQRGRLFGISGGLGMQFVSGNRGAVYQGGFPLIDLRLHYWFDFHLAMDLQFSIVNHFYEDATNIHEVVINRIGGDVKYYFDLSNLSAAITFANPYILLGLGAYSRTQSNSATPTPPEIIETKVGFSGGVGFEFPIKPKKMYFTVEGRAHLVTYSDTYTSPVSTVPDLTGLFWTASGNFLLTW